MLHDNNIEDQLRQLDDSLAPELDNMDAHWQQMEAMLQPAAVVPKKPWPKWMLNGVLGTVVVVVTLLWWVLQPTTEPATNTASYQAPSVSPGDSVVADTIASVESETTGTEEQEFATTKIQANKPTYVVQADSLQAALDALKINLVPCASCPAANIESTESADAVERSSLFNSLVRSLQKAPQEFVVNNGVDTLLQAREGTVLYIPAGSLGGNGAVQLQVKEYYKVSEMVLNQLSTSSNKEQLESGGMLHISATVNGNNVDINPGKPLRLYLADTSSKIAAMQLFTVSENAKPAVRPGTSTFDNIDIAEYTVGGMNWVPQNRYFTRSGLVTEVKVLNLINQPVKVKERSKGRIGYFVIDEETSALSKAQLAEKMKATYGYQQIRFRSSIRNWFKRQTEIEFDNRYATKIGDSMWMDKEVADRYKLPYTQLRQLVVNNTSPAVFNRSAEMYYSSAGAKSGSLMAELKSKYSVDLTRLGWINCDRFYADSRPKVDYTVNLGDKADNYFTVLVFDKMKSMLSGTVYGDRVVFRGVPNGAAVTIVSIGINKKCETVFTQQPAIIDDADPARIIFKTGSVHNLKASLSKMDE